MCRIFLDTRRWKIEKLDLPSTLNNEDINFIPDECLKQFLKAESGAGVKE